MIERGTGVFHLEQWLASRIHIPLRAFSPRKGLIFHNPVIKDGREREREDPGGMYQEIKS